MAFNLGKNNKDLFKKLKKLSPRQRIDYMNKQGQRSAATDLSQLTPTQFAELFPKYYQKGLPDVAGFREAISRRSSQKQDDINFGLSQGANTVEEAERYGQWRRRGKGEDAGTTSSTTGSTRASGSLAANQREAYRAAKAEGLSDTAAKALVANMSGEGLANPGAVNKDYNSRGEFVHMARGIVQWDPPRSEAIKRHFGKYPNEMTVAEQTRAAIWEMKSSSDPRLQATWATLNDPKATPDQMIEVLVRKYERSAFQDRDIGNRMRFYRGLNVDTTDPQTDISSSVSKNSSKSGGVLGNGECVALSKHFSGLGPASKWTFNHDAKIVAGSVIATTNYGNGNGGRHAADMPDKKSHYHTGIALTSPNANGDVLILEQFQGQPARVAMVNINNYRGSGERMAVVAGGEPTANSMKAVELGRTLANPDQLAWINSTGGDMSTMAADVKPVQQAPTAAKPAPTTQDQQQQPTVEQKGPDTKQTATLEKVDKAKKTTESYKFDPDKYWTEVKTKQPMADSMFAGKEYVMKETYKGFEEAQAAGAIKWNKKTNEIQVLDPNHEKVQEIYTKMQDNNIDRNAFLKKTEAGGAGSGTAKVKHVKKQPFVETYDGFLPDVRHDVGAITGQFETGKYGSKAAFSVDTISTGKNDRGGISYGRHQLSSKSGTMADFLKSDEGKPFKEHFGNHTPGSAKFNAAYKKLAAEKPDEFDKAQHDFLTRTHYTPFMKAAARLGYTVEDPRIQEAVFGGGVQFRNNMRSILNKASHSVGKSVEDQVMAIADAKQQHAPTIKNRYQPEAQAILGIQPNVAKRPDINQANVMDIKKYDQYAFEQKSKKATYIAQHQDAQPDTETKQVAGAKPARDPFGQAFAATSDSETSARTAAIQRAQPDLPITPGSMKISNQPAPTQEISPTAADSVSIRQTPIEKRQMETVIDPGLNRQNREFPSVSLERAVRNHSDPSGAMHFGGTRLGQ